MEHVVTIDRRAPLAFDRTPLSIALEGMRGPRTPFSPERTVVTLPDTNPEEEESLAGALERQGATSGRTTCGANQSTVTGDGLRGDVSYILWRNLMMRMRIFVTCTPMVRTSARYGAHEPVNSARRRESDDAVGAHSNAPGYEPSPTDGGDGCGARQSDKYWMEVRLRRRRPGEPLSSLHHDIRRLMTLAYPTLKPDARESIACDHYIDALDDADFGLKVRERAPTSLEAWIKDATRTRREQSTKPKVRGANEPEDDNEQLSARLNHLEGDMSRCLKELMRSNGASPQGAKKVDAHPVVDDRKPKAMAPEPGMQWGFRMSKLVCW